MLAKQTCTDLSELKPYLTWWCQVLRDMSCDGRCDLGKDRHCFWADNKTILSQALIWIAQNPEQYLGDLPHDAREGIRHTLHTYDRWQKGIPSVNQVFDGCTRGLTKLSHTLKNKNPNRYKPLRRQLFNLASALNQVRVFGYLAIYLKLLHLVALYKRRDHLISVLSAVDVQPSDFMRCAAKPIPQPSRFRGYWHDPARNLVVGYIIGIDFIVTEQGCWFIENNIGPTMAFERSAMYQRDPLITNLIEFAKANGYEHLMVMAIGTFYGLNPLMSRHFDISARELDFPVTVVEGPLYLGNDHPRGDGIPENLENRLIAWSVATGTTVNYMLSNKQITTRVLLDYITEKQPPPFFIPSEYILASPSGHMEEPFPTYVYKHPVMEQGQGVVFIKAQSIDHADEIIKRATTADFPDDLNEEMITYVKTRPMVIQRYIRSSLVSGKHMYKIRSHALVSPIGNKFLSAHRVVSTLSLPNHLPEGIVKNPDLFNVNIYKGAGYSLLPKEEDAVVRKATLAVAEGFSQAIETMFQTTPDADKIKGF